RRVENAAEARVADAKLDHDRLATECTGGAVLKVLDHARHATLVEARGEGNAAWAQGDLRDAGGNRPDLVVVGRIPRGNDRLLSLERRARVGLDFSREDLVPAEREGAEIDRAGQSVVSRICHRSPPPLFPHRLVEAFSLAARPLDRMMQTHHAACK